MVTAEINKKLQTREWQIFQVLVCLPNKVFTDEESIQRKGWAIASPFLDVGMVLKTLRLFVDYCSSSGWLMSSHIDLISACHAAGAVGRPMCCNPRIYARVRLT
jgi:hypothetical protein